MIEMKNEKLSANVSHIRITLAEDHTFIIIEIQTESTENNCKEHTTDPSIL